MSMYDDRTDQRRQQRPTTTSLTQMLPMVGRWLSFNSTPISTTCADSMNMRHRSNFYKHLQRNHKTKSCRNCLRKQTFVHHKRLPELLYMILFIHCVVYFNLIHSCSGFTILHNRNRNNNCKNNNRRLSHQVSTWSTATDAGRNPISTTPDTATQSSSDVPNLFMDSSDNAMMQYDNSNNNDVNDESTASSNTVTRTLHPSAVSLLRIASNGDHPKKSNHPIQMMHRVLRQTSRVNTAAVLAACTTTDIQSTEQQIIQRSEHPQSQSPAQGSIIKTTIDSVLLRSQQKQQLNQNSHYNLSFLSPPTSPLLPSTKVCVDPSSNDIVKTAAFSTTESLKQPMGISVLDDDDDGGGGGGGGNRNATFTANSSAFSVATHRSNELHPDTLIYEESFDQWKQQNTVTKVRFATPNDDMDVAYLRMSVFSDINTNTDLIRSQFCTRSCQAIASRRLRGAICFVATTSSTRTVQPYATSPSNHIHINQDHDRNENVIGSIECSYHEFFHTRLGSCRKQYALLYITEVAVHSSVRRRGIGTKLLNAVDLYAMQRRQSFMSDTDNDNNRNTIIESLYLHVDVSNYAAIRMYEQCGYYKVLSNDPMYTEFTTGLNLQPGATRGREHYLLCKNIVANPVWLPSDSRCTQQTEISRNDADRQRHPILSRLGIEIPA